MMPASLYVLPYLLHREAPKIFERQRPGYPWLFKSAAQSLCGLGFYAEILGHPPISEARREALVEALEDIL